MNTHNALDRCIIMILSLLCDMTVKVKVAITSNTAELYVTKLTAALFVICLECYETIRGHQKKGEKFKGQGQMC